MNRSEATASKFIYIKWWALVAFGLFLAIVQPDGTLGWILCNMALFQLIEALLIIPHELGHAIAARCLGMRVLKIEIGSGQILWTQKLLGMLWEFKKVPYGGITSFLNTSKYRYRLRHFLVFSCGPLANLLLIILLLQIPQSLVLKIIPGTRISPGFLFYCANAWLLFINLFPFSSLVNGQKLPNDGLQMLTVFFLSQQTVCQRIALSLTAEGQEWIGRGKFESAIQNFNRAIQQHPACLEAYQERGRAYQFINRYSLAIADFEHLIQIDPQRAIFYVLRGIAYYNWRPADLSYLHQAIADCDQAIQLDSKIELAYSVRAACYSYLGDDLQAIEDFTTVIALNPSAIAYYNRGAVYAQQCYPQAALKDFNRSLALNHRNSAAYYSRGNTKFDLQDQTGAFQDYKRALGASEAFDPKDEHGFYARGIAHERLEEKTKAVQDLQTAEALCLENGNASLLQQIRTAKERLINDAS
jgi:tetratricopeptide (TPR) repeat protein